MTIKLNIIQRQKLNILIPVNLPVKKYNQLMNIALKAHKVIEL